ncbi:hypothetical protein T492DRAFT_1127836 [Pavlovales sp. CCMP2436]|nr:hypothetical protein T492DRAFT_1127836 [Pavlovales sp. CCMP2436]
MGSPVEPCGARWTRLPEIKMSSKSNKQMMPVETPPLRRYDMKVRPRLGCGLSDDSQTYICRSCEEKKTADEMNHRRRRTGLVTVATICCLCYREQIQPDPQTQDPGSPDPRIPGSQDPRIPGSPDPPKSSVGPKIQPDPTDPARPRILRNPRSARNRGSRPSYRRCPLANGGTPPSDPSYGLAPYKCLPPPPHCHPVHGCSSGSWSWSGSGDYDGALQGKCNRTQVQELQSHRNPYAQYQSSYRDRGINLKHFGALRYVVQRWHNIRYNSCTQQAMGDAALRPAQHSEQSDASLNPYQ